MVISFLGHRKIYYHQELEKQIFNLLRDIIVKTNEISFLFGSKSQFIELCYRVVSKLKEEFNYVKRIYVRAEYPKTNHEYEKYIRKLYEDSYYFDKSNRAFKLNYIKRNELMIDKSDLCIFYYNKEYCLNTKNISGTEIAYRYASKKGKKIINCYI